MNRLRHALLAISCVFLLALLPEGTSAADVPVGPGTPAPAVAGGCSAQQLATLAKFAQGAQYLGTLIDVADTGSRLFFDRHPNMEGEQHVKQRIAEARRAQQALDRVLAAASAAGAGDVQGAQTAALQAYAELRDLLYDLGVPQAKPPAGGPETDAPEPTPFELPPKDRVAALMSS